MLVSLVFFRPVAWASDWYGDAWPYRLPLTINHTAVVDGPHNSFPILVSLTLSEPNKVQVGGQDLVFTKGDGLTQLDHEIESWDETTGRLVAWVRMPVLSGVSDDNLYLYYGNAVANDQQHKTAVWEDDFRLVQHMKGAPYADSTGNANNGTLHGGVTVGEGIIGNAGNFDGANGYVSVANAASLQISQALTVSFWLKNDNPPKLYDGILGKPNDWWSDSYGFFFTNSDHLKFFISQDSGPGVTAAVRSGEWNYVTGIYDGTQIRLGVNGQEGQPYAYNQAISVNNYPFTIGRLSAADYDTQASIDEVRISSVARSFGWIATEYANQYDPGNFVRVGSEERRGATIDHIYISGSATQVAGSSQNIHLILQDAQNSVVAFSGERDLIFSGFSPGFNNTVPVCTNKNQIPVALGVTTTLMFSQGEADCTLTLYRRENARLDVSDGIISSHGTDTEFGLPLQVTASSARNMSVIAPSTVTLNNPFTVILHVYDAFGNKAGLLAEPVAVWVENGTLTPSVVGQESFVEGVATTTFAIGNPGATSPVVVTWRSGVALATTSLMVDFPPTVPVVNKSQNGGGVNYVSGGGMFAHLVTKTPIRVAPSPSTTPDLKLPVTTSTILVSAPVQTPLPFKPAIGAATTSLSVTPLPLPPKKLAANPLVVLSQSHQNDIMPLSLVRSVSTNTLPTFSERAFSVGYPFTPFVSFGNLTLIQKKKFPPKIFFVRDEQWQHEYALEPMSDGSYPRAQVWRSGEVEILVRFLQPTKKVSGYIVPVPSTSTPAMQIPVQSVIASTFVFSPTDESGFLVARLPVAAIGENSTLVTTVEYTKAGVEPEVLFLSLSHPAGHVLLENNKPVEGAVVTLYQLNPNTNSFTPWVAPATAMPNPQLTAKNGEYFFNAPPGVYRLEVHHDDFSPFTSTNITLAFDQAIKNDFVIKPRSLWRSMWQGLKKWLTYS